MKANTVLDLIGNTPHLRLGKLFPEHQVWIKLENTNPGGSIKDRIALAMIEDAEDRGWLRPGGTIIEPTSGNTGIGLALAGAVRSYRVILVMPESMSVERRRILASYGAELVLTPKDKGMKGAIERAENIASGIKGSFMPMQFKNMANPDIHARVTASEVLRDFPGGFDYLISGIGTGGHISGVGKKMKESISEIKVIGVEPALSPVLSGGEPSPHPLQGIGAGFVPDTLDTVVLDEIITIEKEEAFSMVRKAAKTEGLFTGISTGASLAAVDKKLRGMEQGRRVLTFAYDTGERYLSVDGLW